MSVNLKNVMDAACPEAAPDWVRDVDGRDIPQCSDACEAYDGKRCQIIGCRPSRLCEPMVAAVIAELEKRL